MEQLMMLAMTLALFGFAPAVASGGAPEPTYDGAKASGQGPAQGVQGPTFERRPLGGTEWLLVRFQSMDDTALTPAATSRYSLSFGKDGSLQVQADCNRGRGTWRSPDNVSLALGPIALTRAMCPSSPLQNRFVRDLGFVRSYVLRDGHLYLSLMADGGIYEFEPAAPPPAR